MKILFLDTEFNNYKQLLSTGIIYTNNLNLNKINEEFFSNKSDKRTVKIHGLETDFLKKYGTNKPSILKKDIFHQKYICGFGLAQDLDVLKLKTSDFFYKNKIIDLSLIIDSLGYKFSLSDFAHKLGLLKKYKTFLPIHTAVMDSYLCFLILRKLINFLEKKTELNKNEILEIFANLSKAKYFKIFSEVENISNSLTILKDFLKEKSLIEKIKICNIPFAQAYSNNNTLIFNKDNFIIAKYKDKIDFNLKVYPEVRGLSFLNIGYKGVTNG